MKNRLYKWLLSALLIGSLSGCSSVPEHTGAVGERNSPETVGNEQKTSTKFAVKDGFTVKDDMPDVLILNVTLPEVDTVVKGAEGVNEKITEDFQWVIDLKRENYSGAIEDWGFAYPVLEIYYEVIGFEDIYELCIFQRIYSSMGSGTFHIVNKYYYDGAQEREISDGEFLRKVGWSEPQVLDYINQEYAVAMGEGITDFQYADIVMKYYIDQDRQINPLASLLGLS